MGGRPGRTQVTNGRGRRGRVRDSAADRTARTRRRSRPRRGTTWSTAVDAGLGVRAVAGGVPRHRPIEHDRLVGLDDASRTPATVRPARSRAAERAPPAAARAFRRARRPPPPGCRKRSCTWAGSAADVQQREPHVEELRSARPRRDSAAKNPRGCVPACCSCALVRPSPSGSPIAPSDAGRELRVEPERASPSRRAGRRRRRRRAPS